jgi:hypothetical protein
MQTVGHKARQSNLARVVVTFFIGGALGGALFAFFVARPGLKKVWFITAEWWIFPTGRFWALAGVMFLASLAASYAFAISRGWLEAPTQWHRVLMAAGLGGVIPFLLNFLSKPSTSVIGFFLGPIVVALFLSTALFALTSRWYKSATALMVLIYLAAPLLAGIPDLFISGEDALFDALAFSIRASLLTALCGWWLVRARPAISARQDLKQRRERNNEA